jgi:hypothetical protein
MQTQDELNLSAGEVFGPVCYGSTADAAGMSVDDILAKVEQLALWASSVVKSLPADYKSMIRLAAMQAFEQFAAPRLGPIVERFARAWLVSQLDSILGG